MGFKIIDISSEQKLQLSNVASRDLNKRFGKRGDLLELQVCTLSNELLSLNLATVIRDEVNPDLPLTSKLGNTSSDIVGELNLKPNKFLDLEYNFSLDNDLSSIDYSKANAEISVNNFITSFEFLEKNNIIRTESYLSNKTTFNFDDNNSLNFQPEKIKKKILLNTII